MSTEPVVERPEDEVMDETEKKKGMCPTPQEVKLFCCNPNGGGPGVFTCLCGITPKNWAIILVLFAIYYAFLGLFFWALIEAMFKVKAQGSPEHSHATD